MSGFLNFIKAAANAVSNVVSEIVNSKPFQAVLEYGKELAIEVASQFVKGQIDKAANKIATSCSIDLKKSAKATDALVSQMNAMKTPKETGISASGALNNLGKLGNVAPLLAVK